MKPVEYFSSTVPEAHQKFVDACEMQGIDIEVFQHPLKDPDGNKLSTAVCRIGSVDAENALFIMSGTHGIEGYAGSGVQIGALHNLSETIPLGENMAAVMLHMINPWGAAWNRKENEDNVECLQNFFYADREKPENPLFEAFDDAINLKDIKSLEEFVAAQHRVQALFQEHGQENVMAALRNGQASRPRSIMFCGTEPTWSKRTLDCVALKYLQGVKRVAFLDLHTAVGGYGDAVVIPEEASGSQKSKMVTAWFDGDIWSNEPLHAGIYGFIENLIPGCEVVSTVVEFGTEPTTEENEHIFVLDTWLHNYGDPKAPENQPIIQRYRRFFYPETDDWKALVWQNGQKRLQQITSGLSRWANLA